MHLIVYRGRRALSRTGRLLHKGGGGMGYDDVVMMMRCYDEMKWDRVSLSNRREYDDVSFIWDSVSVWGYRTYV